MLDLKKTVFELKITLKNVKIKKIPTSQAGQNKEGENPPGTNEQRANWKQEACGEDKGHRSSR